MFLKKDFALLIAVSNRIFKNKPKKSNNNRLEMEVAICKKKFIMANIQLHKIHYDKETKNITEYITIQLYYWH